MRMIINFILFGIVFVLMYRYIPDTFNTLVGWANNVVDWGEQMVMWAINQVKKSS